MFRGRTVRETDLAAGGAAAANNPGSQFCRGCGALFLHPIHLRSEAHRARVGRLQAVCDPPTPTTWRCGGADRAAHGARRPAAPPPGQEADGGGLLDNFLGGMDM
ncbi:unnamed protein product [Ixodes pacificus]